MERKSISEKQKARLRMVLGITVCLWTALGGRLYYLQVLSHDDLSAAADAEHQAAVEGLDSRGSILDRNLQPLTGGVNQFCYFIQAEREDSGSARLLAAVSARKVSPASDSYGGCQVYRTQILDETVNRRLKEEYGAYVLSVPSRYSDSQTACHLIGYLNDAEQIGVAGLERQYEARLKSDGSQLTLLADGSGALLLNQPPALSQKTALSERNLVTTIDRGLQQLCETSMEERNLQGAVLVSEAESGEVLAWVSSPAFNPNQISLYLESGGDNLVNKCIQGTYAPGSVFKIAVAAAALESSLADPNETWLCTGQTEVEGVRLGCAAGPEGGHGEVNLARAMAVSCNCYFAQLGDRLGWETIRETAENLGFGQIVFEGFTEEAAGSLPTSAETGPWDISNLSIGQGTLLTTPAQVHQMMAVVAGSGVLHPLTVTYSGSGASGSSLPAKSILSPYTASRLTEMLGLVMTEGTGSGLSWACPVYGKTGTAETTDGGTDVKNCWFSGFCRVDGRNYVVTVLAEEGVSGTASALPVFHDVSEYLAAGNFSMALQRAGAEE